MSTDIVRRNQQSKVYKFGISISKKTLEPKLIVLFAKKEKRNIKKREGNYRYLKF